MGILDTSCVSVRRFMAPSEAAGMEEVASKLGSSLHILIPYSSYYMYVYAIRHAVYAIRHAVYAVRHTVCAI